MVSIETALLESFVAIVRYGSFTRAADALSITQPTISNRIATLEAQLGGTLFDREGRRVSLSSLGTIFLPFAERALTAIEDGVQAVQQVQDGIRGQLRIATLDTHATYLLQGPLSQFREQFPAIDIIVRPRIPGDILKMVRDGEVELGLTGTPIWDRKMQIQWRYREVVKAVISVEHRLAKLGRVTVADICQHTVYRVTQGPSVTAIVEQIAEQARAGSGGAWIHIPASLAIDSLVAGQGVAFLPEPLIQPYLESQALLALDVVDLPPLENEVVLISWRDRVLSPVAQNFLEMLE